MAKVSIIVPIYNVEPYLDQCVQSLIHQTYSDIEIILINDGSPDRCPEMCDEYADKDNRIRIIHQENKGVSVARNAGIDAATGEWILFCDPDDWYELNAVEIMLAHAKRGCVIVECGIVFQYSNYANPIHNAEKKGCLTEQDKIFMFTSRSAWWVALSRIYSKKMIVENHIRFTPGIAQTQEVMFSMKALNAAESVFVGSEYVYNYRVAENYNSGGHPHRIMAFRYYPKIMNELRDFVDKSYPEKIANDIYSAQGYFLMNNGFSVGYIDKRVPLRFHERLSGIKKIITNEPWNSVLDYKGLALQKKHQIAKFLLHYRLIFPYYLLKKLWPMLKLLTKF